MYANSLKTLKTTPNKGYYPVLPSYVPDLFQLAGVPKLTKVPTKVRIHSFLSDE